MSRMSRAVVFAGDGTWELRELPVPDRPVEGGAILRVEAAGMCHSDINMLEGVQHTPWGGEYPSIPGHEIVGRIEQLSELAAATWGVAEGDRVVVANGRWLPDGRRRIYGHDYAVTEGSGLYGGFADYMDLQPGTAVFKAPVDIPASEVTFAEPLASAVTWVEPVQAGDTVVVMGPGHMGLATAVAARVAGAGRVILTGRSADAFRLQVARSVGVELTIDVDAQDAVEAVRAFTDGVGADVVVDAVPGTTSTVTQAMQMLRVGGALVIAGMKDRKPVEGFISDWIPMRRIRILPGMGLDFAASTKMIADGLVPTSKVVGEFFALDQFGQAIELMERKIEGRDAIRVGLWLTEG